MANYQNNFNMFKEENTFEESEGCIIPCHNLGMEMGTWTFHTLEIYFY